MAVALNKKRMLISRIIIGIVLLLVLFTEPVLSRDSLFYAVCELVGYALLIACVVGRIYSTAFIGGLKNKNLVTEGPYSVCRNPLYFYSLLGMAGVGMLTAQLVPFVLLVGGFFLMYQTVIRREEKFLSEKFSKTFEEYRAQVPRFWPKFSLFKVPEELVFQPKYFTYAVWDAVWWFIPIPLFFAMDYLHDIGVIKPALILF